MNAAAIINEIKQLPRDEREEVVRFVSEMKLREEREWSPEKLGEYAEGMMAAGKRVFGQTISRASRSAAPSMCGTGTQSSATR